MDPARIGELLVPFVPSRTPSVMLDKLAVYLDLLTRWNRRMNLTAIRDEDRIVTRHFGESLFAADQWLPGGESETGDVVDVGSGGGFPGILLKLQAPAISLTLVEAHGKKATFLREVVRSLGLEGVCVANVRAEELIADPAFQKADLITLRAVERFDVVLRAAGSLARPGGRLGLLIGSSQVPAAKRVLQGWNWESLVDVPSSESRLVATVRYSS